MSMDVGAKKGPRSDINITPLVDIVLVLLIIFMVLTPLMEKELAVRVPEEPTPEELAQPPPPDLTQFIFKVDEAGLFHVNNEALTDDNAAERLKVYYRAAKAKEATQGPPVIFFDADDKAKYERAIKGLDLIRDSSAGWTIGMMTEKIASQAPAGETAPGAAPEGTPPAPEPRRPRRPVPRRPPRAEPLPPRSNSLHALCGLRRRPPRRLRLFAPSPPLPPRRGLAGFFSLSSTNEEKSCEENTACHRESCSAPFPVAATDSSKMARASGKMLCLANAWGEKRRFLRSPERRGWAARMSRARSAIRLGSRAVRTISASTTSGATMPWGKDQGVAPAPPTEKSGMPSLASRSSWGSSARSAPSSSGAWAGSAATSAAVAGGGSGSGSSIACCISSRSRSSSSSGGGGASPSGASAGSGSSFGRCALGIGPRGAPLRGRGARRAARSTASEGISPTRTWASSASRARRWRSAASGPLRSRCSATGGKRTRRAPTSLRRSNERREARERR